MLCGATLGIAGMTLPLALAAEPNSPPALHVAASAGRFSRLDDRLLAERPEPAKHDPMRQRRAAHRPSRIRGRAQHRPARHQPRRDGGRRLRRFAERSGCDGVAALAKFVRESQRLGTQLTEALRIHADMLRIQREAAAEETAQKAAVKILMPDAVVDIAGGVHRACRAGRDPNPTDVCQVKAEHDRSKNCHT